MNGDDERTFKEKETFMERALRMTGNFFVPSQDSQISKTIIISLWRDRFFILVFCLHVSSTPVNKGSTGNPWARFLIKENAELNTIISTSFTPLEATIFLSQFRKELFVQKQQRSSQWYFKSNATKSIRSFSRKDDVLLRWGNWSNDVFNESETIDFSQSIGWRDRSLPLQSSIVMWSFQQPDTCCAGIDKWSLFVLR